MSPAAGRTVMTLVGVVAGALTFVPALLPFREALIFIAGALGGGAHIARPGDLANLAAAKQALAEKVAGE